MEQGAGAEVTPGLLDLGTSLAVGFGESYPSRVLQVDSVICFSSPDEPVEFLSSTSDCHMLVFALLSQLLKSRDNI